MEEFMLAEKAPAGYKGQISFDVSKTIDIGDGVTKSYTVHYDEYGFPEFKSFSPGSIYEYKSLPNPSLIGDKTSSGSNTDINLANKAMSKYFNGNSSNNFIWDGQSKNFFIVDSKGNKIQRIYPDNGFFKF